MTGLEMMLKSLLEPVIRKIIGDGTLETGLAGAVGEWRELRADIRRIERLVLALHATPAAATGSAFGPEQPGGNGTRNPTYLLPDRGDE